MRNKRYLILSFYYQPDLSAGSFRTTAFVKSLKKKISADDTIEVLTTMPNRYHTFEQKAKLIEVDGNITIHRFSIPSHKSGFIDQAKAFFSYYIDCKKFVKKKKYDLVFATSSRLFTAFLGYRIAKTKKIPLYLDIRDIFLDTINSLFANKKFRYFFPFFILRLIEKKTFIFASKINLVSKGFSSYFLQFQPEEKLSFYSNGIDDDFLNVNFKKEVFSEPKKIVYAGNIGEGQGLHKIIPSIAEYLGSKYIFQIIGEGGMRWKLQEELTLANIKNVQLINPVPRKEIIKYYQQCDFLFLHLNDYDAFKKVLPSKIFEYGVTGKPVFAGVGGYAKEFINKYLPKWIVFNPADFNDFKIKFEARKKVEINSESFIQLFTREKLMDNLTIDFLSFTKRN